MFRGTVTGSFVRRIGSLTVSQSQQSLRRSLSTALGCHINKHLTSNLTSHGKLLGLQYNQSRNFWGVDVAFNRVDKERVRLAGPDRAAAEWVLRNGGTIKWTTSSNTLDDYNMLPSTQFESYKLEELDLSGTDIIGMGFEHLRDLHHVRKIRIHGCKTLGDDGISHFFHVSDTLTSLEISGCPMITERGLNNLCKLKKLKHLILFDLMEINNLETVAANLRQKMPGVDIKTKASSTT